MNFDNKTCILALANANFLSLKSDGRVHAFSTRLSSLGHKALVGESLGSRQSVIRLSWQHKGDVLVKNIRKRCMMSVIGSDRRIRIIWT